ncbi:MAG TPA: hypothetical protein VGI81_22920 [Tepidisphaeraceae bacterium]
MAERLEEPVEEDLGFALLIPRDVLARPLDELFDALLSVLHSRFPSPQQ